MLRIGIGQNNSNFHSQKQNPSFGINFNCTVKKREMLKGFERFEALYTRATINRLLAKVPNAIKLPTFFDKENKKIIIFFRDIAREVKGPVQDFLGRSSYLFAVIGKNTIRKYSPENLEYLALKQQARLVVKARHSKNPLLIVRACKILSWDDPKLKEYIAKLEKKLALKKLNAQAEEISAKRRQERRLSEFV